MYVPRMADIEALEQRLAAVERTVVDEDHDLEDLAKAATLAEDVERLETRLEAVEERVAELEAVEEALRGHVSEIQAVNEDVERRAGLALAATERLERRVDELVADTDESDVELTLARPDANGGKPSINDLVVGLEAGTDVDAGGTASNTRVPAADQETVDEMLADVETDREAGSDEGDDDGGYLSSLFSQV